MVTDDIMQIVWDMQDEIKESIKGLEDKLMSGNMNAELCGYMVERESVKLDVLNEVEEKLSNYEGCIE